MVFKYGEYVGLRDAVRRSLSCEENHFDESCSCDNEAEVSIDRIYLQKNMGLTK